MRQALYKCGKIVYNYQKGRINMRTHESQEMYLETILLLRMRKANVRSVDIVEELGYAKSSVSRASSSVSPGKPVSTSVVMAQPGRYLRRRSTARMYSSGV